MKKYINKTEKILNENFIYLDLETLGLSKNSPIISASFTKENQVITYVLTNLKEEIELLEIIYKETRDKLVVTYNGDRFDLKLLKYKGEKYNINFEFKSLDYYQVAKKYAYLFESENLKQGTMEKFFGLYREEDIKGSQVIDCYKNYLKTKNEKYLDSIGKHNSLDVKGLIYLDRIKDYVDNKMSFFYDNKKFLIKEINFEKDILYVKGKTNSNNLYFSNKVYEIKALENNFYLKIFTEKALYNKNTPCNYIFLKENFLKSQIEAPENIFVLKLGKKTLYKNSLGLIKAIIENKIKFN